MTRRRHRRHGACLLATIAAGAAALAILVSPSEASEVTHTWVYEYSGRGAEWFYVPRNLVRMHVTLDGAIGEAGGASQLAKGGAGGQGGRIGFTIVMGHGVHAGDRLELWVGGRGDWATHVGPLAGGPGGAGAVQTASGGHGGDGTGIYNTRSGQWLGIAGGGGGGGGVGGLYFEAPGGHGGRSNQPGQSTLAAGGALRAACSSDGPGSLPLAGGHGAKGAGALTGSAGGGGGGCAGGHGGAQAKISSGPGGAGGRDWTFAGARDVSHGIASGPDGRVEIRMVTYSQPRPQFATPDHVDLVEGEPVSFDVIAEGSPPPDMRVIGGAFPEGTTFRVGLFEGVGRLRGTPAPGTAGTYHVTIRIENDWGSDRQTLAIDVHPPRG
jgi:hypothetical protein